uniref:Uncharacterized protein n=1 Tax=Anguilla anguilla TaxID=7936 RepID=A0A0E9PV62_ANGAN
MLTGCSFLSRQMSQVNNQVWFTKTVCHLRWYS